MNQNSHPHHSIFSLWQARIRPAITAKTRSNDLVWPLPVLSVRYSGAAYNLTLISRVKCVFDIQTQHPVRIPCVSYQAHHQERNGCTEIHIRIRVHRRRLLSLSHYVPQTNFKILMCIPSFTPWVYVDILG